MTTQTFSDAQIAEAAFYIWLDEGKPAGRDFYHWAEAKARLESAARPSQKKRAAAKPAAKPATAKPSRSRAKKPPKVDG